MSVLTIDPDIGKLYEICSDHTDSANLHGQVVFVLDKGQNYWRTWYRVLHGEEILTINHIVHFAELTPESNQC